MPAPPVDVNVVEAAVPKVVVTFPPPERVKGELTVTVVEVEEAVPPPKIFKARIATV